MFGFLIELLVIILIASLILWIAGQFVTDAVLLKIIRVVVVVIVAVWLIYALAGFLPTGPPFGRLH